MPKTASTELTLVDDTHAPKSVITDMANRFHMEPPAFEAALRATVVPKDCSPAQFAAFLMVAKEYNLNPLTKEIYAFPARGGGIVPIVSVDGWVNLVNSQGQCDGFSFEMEKEGDKLISCTCRMYRKDRKHPVEITEYFAECVRATDPWKMKHRMLRHKALIQAARYAFGFSGIYDEDEGEKIAAIDPNKDAGPPRQVTVLPDEPKQIETKPEPEEARDGNPPPRTPKADPISSGPPRTTAPQKETGPSDPGPQPHRIPGTGHTYESWAEKYCDMIKTSPDLAVVYAWVDINTREFVDPPGTPKQAGPLTRLQKGKPSVYATVKKTTENIMQALRDAAEKTSEKAAKKANPAGDMDAGAEMDTPAGTPDTSGGPSDTNPETILKWAKAQFAKVDDPDNLETFYTENIEPHIRDLFPPDHEEIMAEYRLTERRLGGD